VSHSLPRPQPSTSKRVILMSVRDTQKPLKNMAIPCTYHAISRENGEIRFELEFEECLTRGVEFLDLEKRPTRVNRERWERASWLFCVYRYFRRAFRDSDPSLDALTPVCLIRGPSVTPWVALGPRLQHSSNSLDIEESRTDRLTAFRHLEETDRSNPLHKLPAANGSGLADNPGIALIAAIAFV